MLNSFPCYCLLRAERKLKLLFWIKYLYPLYKIFLFFSISKKYSILAIIFENIIHFYQYFLSIYYFNPNPLCLGI
jgi:hypothetical protein